MIDGATSQKSQKEMLKPWYLPYYSTSRDNMGVKRSSMVNFRPSNWFGPLFSSQNWTNWILIIFVGFFSHSILAEIQQTKQTNYSSFSLSASLDTPNILQGGMIVHTVSLQYFRSLSFPIIFHLQVSALHTFFRESTTFISILSSFNDFYIFWNCKMAMIISWILMENSNCFLWRQSAWKCIQDEI